MQLDRVSRLVERGNLKRNLWNPHPRFKQGGEDVKSLAPLNSGVCHLSKVVSNRNLGLQLHRVDSSLLFSLEKSIPLEYHSPLVYKFMGVRPTYVSARMLIYSHFHEESLPALPQGNCPALRW